MNSQSHSESLFIALKEHLRTPLQKKRRLGIFVLSIPLEVIDQLKSEVTTLDFNQVVRECLQLGLIPTRLTAEELQQLVSRCRNYDLANQHYCARSLPIAVYLFAATDRESQSGHEVGEYRLRNWDSVLPTEQIHLVLLPGTHHSMMDESNIAFLGQALSALIRIPHDDSATSNLKTPSQFCPPPARQPGALNAMQFRRSRTLKDGTHPSRRWCDSATRQL